jgi:hypothetical protein
MDTVECREVIVSTLSRRGTGTDYNPVRVILEVFEKDGTKIAENDPFLWRDSGFPIRFARWCLYNGLSMGEITSDAVEQFIDNPNPNLS